MRASSAAVAAAIVLGVAAFAPTGASAQGVSVYVGPGYPGAYTYYAPYSYGYAYGYPRYGYAYPSYGYAYPGYGYGYGRPYYGGYWGQGRRIARRVNRRWDRWD
jgi:hypothetical protein